MWLYKTKKFADQYTEEDKKGFVEYITNGIKELAIPKSKNDLEQIVLSIYANPVKNKLEL